MPIIEVKKKENSYGKIIVFKCDQCGKIKTRKYCKHHLEKKLFFCSLECLGKSEIIKEKRRQTYVKNYGVDNPLKSEIIKEKCEQTCLKKYGVKHPNESKEIKEKCKIYFIEKYGVENPFQSEEVKKKCRETSKKRYGVDHHMKSEEIKSKFDWSKTSQKTHETKKKNGTYGKSKIEDEYYDYLCELHGKENIERQVKVNKWSIDFYIKSNDIYVQFDGVYWHGLDRNIKIIKEFKNPQDKTIYETYLRDNEQNVWFKDNGLKLVRVTDKEFTHSFGQTNLSR